MIKRLLLFSGIIFCVLGSEAQFDTSFISKNIRRNADSLTHAFKTRNWEKFTTYTYPALVGTLGGKKEFTNYISSMFKEIPDTAWKQYEAGEVLQVIKTDKDYQAIIELKTRVEWQNTRIITVNYLVAESWDGGMFWTFFDSQGDRKAANTINPRLSPSLLIPERKEIRESIIK